jgi:hypothetical protein
MTDSLLLDFLSPYKRSDSRVHAASFRFAALLLLLPDVMQHRYRPPTLPSGYEPSIHNHKADLTR